DDGPAEADREPPGGGEEPVHGEISPGCRAAPARVPVAGGGGPGRAAGGPPMAAADGGGIARGWLPWGDHGRQDWRRAVCRTIGRRVIAGHPKSVIRSTSAGCSAASSAA